MGLNYPPDLKDRIAKVLSDILSDKYDAKITIRFEPKEGARVEKNEIAVVHG